LKWTWKDRWLHVRRSNTEPVVRIIAEAMSESAARKLVSAVQKLAAVAGAA
ncbi:MAG: phosphoglucosamine mutase, partial [Planctomycetes bacterium]|nr:phosphoglucosamine mutase [Planctomycetota bacterium]